MKRLIFLVILLPSLSFADRLGSLNSNAQVILATSTYYVQNSSNPTVLASSQTFLTKTYYMNDGTNVWSVAISTNGAIVTTQIVTSSTLNTGLTSFWKLDESNGTTRADSVGTNNLTNNNTVTQVVGQIGNASGFASASSQSLSITDNATLSPGNTDFTIAGWCYFTTAPASIMALVFKYDGGNSALREYAFYKDASNKFNFLVTANGTVFGIATDSADTVVTSTWYFFVCWHDSVGDTVNIQINNGTIYSTAWTAGLQDTTAKFTMGSYNDAGSANYLNGRLDAVGFWAKALTASERTELYNSGVGKEYPF